MTIDKLVSELQGIQSKFGNLEVYFQNDPHADKEVSAFESFYILPEEYMPDEDHAEKYTVVNLRTYPY
jgi:hypothetical protein